VIASDALNESLECHEKTVGGKREPPCRYLGNAVATGAGLARVSEKRLKSRTLLIGDQSREKAELVQRCFLVQRN